MVVILTLYFNQMVTAEKVKNELVLGVIANNPNPNETLKIDVDSIQVTGNISKLCCLSFLGFFLILQILKNYR